MRHTVAIGKDDIILLPTGEEARNGFQRFQAGLIEIFAFV